MTADHTNIKLQGRTILLHTITKLYACRRRRLGLLLVAVALTIVGCGGGSGSGGSSGSDPAAATPPSASVAPGGLYVGYYAEDSANNPEDPTIGVLHLALPAGDAAFGGSMYFTYVGCQTSNVGTITGTRSGNSLTGNWSGTVDGLAQSGAYNGTYSAGSGAFSGTYTVAGGKQYRDLRPCIQYYIAANGSWELLPVSASVPTNFAVTENSHQLQWTNPATTAMTLVAVIDEAQALAGQASATRYQHLDIPPVQTFNVDTVVGLNVGTRYVVVVAAATATGQRLATSSVVITR